MKFLTFIIFIFLLFPVFSQVSHVDTVYTLDSVWHGDTLYIYKHRHITVIIDNIDTLSKSSDINLSNFSPNKQDIINYNFLSTTYNYDKHVVKPRISSITPNFQVGKMLLLHNKISFYDSVSKPLFCFGNGVLLTYDKNKISYSVGFNYANYFENYNYVDTWQTIDSTINRKINPHSFWTVDTVFFLNLDSLLIGDTVWIPYYDSNFRVEYDTTKIVTFDTSNNSYNYQKINSLNYIEFPIYLSWKFTFNKFIISPKIGFITGILYSSNFRVFTPHVDDIIVPTIFKLNYSAFIGLDLSYKISPKFYFNIGFWSKIPLSYNYTLFNSKYKYLSYGFSGGITYRFGE